jgi:iron complex outermembrane receptor protein
VNQGAQAVNYSALPAAAIKRVEVLRDGAAAQYGSDAIAGVINVISRMQTKAFRSVFKQASTTRMMVSEPASA